MSNTSYLLKKYPNLIELYRKWDCSYEDAIKRIKENKVQKSLNRWM